jgi:hypothetical protein
LSKELGLTAGDQSTLRITRPTRRPETTSVP